MYRSDTGRIVYSPSDLTEFMESRYASWMSRRVLERLELEPAPGEYAARQRLLQKHGEAHERRVIEALRAEGRDLVEIEGDRGQASERTLRAIREGREVICQARLERAPFAGYADFLVRVAAGSKLGHWAYEVWEAKLAHETRPYFLIQLCSYAEMLAEIQDRTPRTLRVALGSGERRAYRSDDYLFYFRTLERQFADFMAEFDPDDRPLPDPRADHRRWQESAERLLEEIDHVSLTAGVGSAQIRNLERERIVTLGGLAQTPLDSVAKIQDTTFARLKDQAKLQVASRGHERPLYRVLPPDPDDPHKGLALLPPPSELDVWFDMEGYPFADLEYLFGAAHLEDGRPEYRDWWAHDARGEQAALEGFVDWVTERWQGDPSMHVYHYAQYELTALKKLMGRYATRENEIDELLRHHVFVDLYAIVRNGLRVGEPSYSLKNLETLYREGGREGAVKSGGDSIVQYEAWLESGQPRDWRASPLLADIRSYNREDCESTRQLADWLRERQAEKGIAHDPEPATADTDKPADDALIERQRVACELLESIPADPDERARDAERWQVQEMLAWLLEFHRREAKPGWWRFFQRLEMTPEQRIDDPECLGGLERTERPPFAVRRSTALEYRFDPEQDTKLEAGDSCGVPQSPDGGVRLETLDRERGLAVIAFARRGAPGDRICLTPNDHVPAAAIEASIYDAAREWSDAGQLRPALRDLLLRRPPRVGAPGPLVQPGEDAQDAVVRLVHALDDSTLCIQGPPGSGKTTAAARAILSLLDAGKKVGVTSNSHKAILNLMEACAELRPGLQCVKVGGDADVPLVRDHAGAVHVQRTGQAASLLASRPLVGGTAWAFSNTAFENRLDHLFVDEAGQVSVANLVGMARSTRNLVLLGDQMQLAQPIQGCHPGDSGRSALDYLLGERATIPPELGVFLDHSWRLHPKLCALISGAVYDDRLEARPGTEQRVVRVPPDGARRVTKEAGLLFVPVEHQGNGQASDEEVECIAALVDELLGREVTDVEGRRAATLGLDEILFVAPYNMQVRRLQAALPAGARIGSVDRFQGQQARVVIVSMCSSEPAASSRGLDFLFNRNRLNVAISRAQSLALVVGSPGLVGGPCATVEQMSLSNLFCRIAEVGSA